MPDEQDANCEMSPQGSGGVPAKGLRWEICGGATFKEEIAQQVVRRFESSGSDLLFWPQLHSCRKEPLFLGGCVVQTLCSCPEN